MKHHPASGSELRAGGRHVAVTLLGALMLVATSLAAVATPAPALWGTERGVAVVAAPGGTGYAIVNATGKQFNCGSSLYTGGVSGTPAVPIVDAAAGPGQGKWFAGADGGAFSFGAPFHGSLPGIRVRPAKPIVAIVASSSKNGYLLVGEDGGTFAFGDFAFPGSLAGTRLSAPIVDAASAPGGGVWLVGADGGVFALGGAPYRGSLPGSGIRPAAHVTAIVPAGNGYHLVGSDGGVFTYTNAGFPGSFANMRLAAPIVDATSDGANGLWLLGADGGIFTLRSTFYGAAVQHGNAPAAGTPIVGNGAIVSVGCTAGGDIKVAATIADPLSQLLVAARADGVNLCGWGFRSPQQQIDLRAKNCGGATHYNIWEKPSSRCRPPTARPGASRHEKGLAVDFTSCSPSSACFRWLSRNAGRYGLRNLPSESWHWSDNGR